MIGLNGKKGGEVVLELVVIHDNRSSLEIGEALESPLLQSTEEGMSITWDIETGERILKEGTNLEVKQVDAH
jgi:hypothetical protein